jgi:hypothetical protein
MSIKNMYEKIPKKLLNKVDNPNYKLHKLNIPFRMCIIASSGSGKTNFVINLLEKFSSGRDGTFASIFIITKNKDEPLYNWLSSISERIIISEGIHNIPKLDNFDKSLNHLVVFDDLVLEKNLNSIVDYYIRCRKMNVSVCFISQSFYKIPKIIRSNCNYMVILKMSGQRDINLILSEFGLGITKDQLLEIYKYATNEKFSPLIIDLESDEDQRFRKGFLEIIPINN